MIARLSRPVSVRRLSQDEHVTIEATEAERAALAEELDLLSLDTLTADVTVRPWKAEGVRVVGTVRGTVSQACVVTLEPVKGTVEETFDVRLHPDVTASASVSVDPDSADPPETLDSDRVDIGAIALEHFALGLDPYPRAPGAAFEVEDDGSADEPSPFAVLAALKNGSN